MKPEPMKRPSAALAVRAPVTTLAPAGPSPDDTRRVMEAFFGALKPRSVVAYREALLRFEGWCIIEGFLDGKYERPLPKVAQLLFSWSAVEAHANVTKYVSAMKKQGLAPNTINLRLTALRGITKLGQQLGLITWTLTVKGSKSENVRDTRGPELQDVKRLLAKAKELGAEEHAMVALMFSCGLRSIELRELQLKHVVLSSAPHLFIRGKGKDGLHRVTVSEELKKVLMGWMRARTLVYAHPAQAPHAADPASFFFPSHRSPMQPLSKDALGKRISRLGAHLGIKVWPHALRHSAITTVLDKNGGDVRLAQKFSRHVNLETLVKYDDARRDLAGVAHQSLAEEL